MFTIPTPSIRATMVAALLLAAGHAHAQTARERLDWPRTFGGQPDFEFTRDEVVREYKTKASQEGQPEPDLPTMEDLLADAKITSLEGEAQPQAQGAATGVTATAAPAASRPSVQLPMLKPNAKVDLQEFRTTLLGALDQQLQSYTFNPYGMDASNLLGALKLETVVTSPIRYAIINGQRYKVGETLILPLRIGPSDVEQLRALHALLPPQDTLTDELYQQYVAVEEEVIRELAALKKSQPQRYQKVFNLPVTLVDLQPRAVVVQFQGQRYELRIPYSY